MSVSAIVVAHDLTMISSTLTSLRNAAEVAQILVVPWRTEPHELADIARQALATVVPVPASEHPFEPAAIAAHYATGDYLLFTVAGITFGPTSIAGMLAAFESGTGIVTPLVVGRDRRVVEAGWSARRSVAGGGYEARFAGSALEVDGVMSGCTCDAARARCMLTPRAVYRQLDGFRALGGAGAYADADYAERVLATNLALRYAPGGAVVDAAAVPAPFFSSAAAPFAPAAAFAPPTAAPTLRAGAPVPTAPAATPQAQTAFPAFAPMVISARDPGPSAASSPGLAAQGPSAPTPTAPTPSAQAVHPLAALPFVPFFEDSAPSAARVAAVEPLEPVEPMKFEPSVEPPIPRAQPQERLASIVMLSWNALEYTKSALDSIRRFTTQPYEIIIVDNGSDAETVAYLRSLADVRTIYNATNTGFAHGSNQGIAAARGEFIVLLNNDVVVTEHWLEDLIGALDRQPHVGMSAPRSNLVAGSQVLEVPYTELEGMHAYAAQRRKEFRETGYFTDRAIGLCLCIRREVIERVGGIDERYAVGNFEDDDFSLRVRAAGFAIYVCDDVFIHHFGHASFKANKVDWNATMLGNWAKFAQKWGYPPEYPVNGYQPGLAIARGFDPAVHYQALPDVTVREPADAVSGEPVERPAHALRLVALVENEQAWSELAAVVRRYVGAFDATTDVGFEIAVCGELQADTVGERVRRLVEKAGRTDAGVADVTVEDVTDVAAWVEAVKAGAQAACVQKSVPVALAGLDVLKDVSPSGLRRFVSRLTPAPVPA